MMNRGFTLIELLIAIAIIAILANTVLGATNIARQKAFTARSQADIEQLRLAVAQLENDTGKWPNGCPPSEVSNPEVALNGAQAGILTAPGVGDQGDGCEWTTTDIALWAGPYAAIPLDPWKNAYYFDPDYQPLENCGSPGATAIPAVVSFGPNKVGLNAYDCDDIYQELR